MLRVGALTQIPSLIVQLGHEPVSVLEEAGIAPDLLNNPGNTITFAVTCNLLAVCSRRLNCAHFGLLFGKQVELSHLGMLGVLVRSSTNVLEALANFIRYQRFLTYTNDVGMIQKSDRVYLNYQEPLGLTGSDQLGTAVLAAICSIINTMCGGNCTPSSVSFAHKIPRDSKPFQEHFKCPLSFSENEYVISYSLRHLNRPLGNFESRLKDVIVEHVEKELFPPTISFTQNVYKLIETSIRTGTANSTAIASMLGISVRTLGRNLAREGFSFQSMLDDMKCKTAINMLGDPNLEISKIADYLGYNDATSFSRAFRRWCNVTPAEWRLRNR